LTRLQDCIRVKLIDLQQRTHTFKISQY